MEEKLFSAGVDRPSFGAILRALPQSPRHGAGDELKKPGEKNFSGVLTATEIAA
jgi:hypothetical protein